MASVYKVKKSTGAILHDHPCSDSPVISTVPCGTECMIGIFAGDWGFTEGIDCTTGGKRSGWIHLDEMDHRPGDFGSGLAIYIVKNPEGAKVRCAPFDSASVIGTARYGKRFSMIQRYPEEGWGQAERLECDNGKQIGWVKFSDIRMFGIARIGKCPNC